MKKGIVFVIAIIFVIAVFSIQAIQAGKYDKKKFDINESGKYFRIEHKENITKIHGNNISAVANLNISSEEDKGNNETKLCANLSNGRKAEIKIMPDTASEMALERLRLKVCNESNNCSLQLKEVGQANNTRIVYALKAQKQFKLLGLFKAKNNSVETEIDAETGEIVYIKMPWWLFLAKEV